MHCKPSKVYSTLLDFVLLTIIQNGVLSAAAASAEETMKTPTEQQQQHCHTDQHLSMDEIEQLIREAEADTRPLIDPDQKKAKAQLERKLFCLESFFEDERVSEQGKSLILNAVEAVTKWLGVCPYWTVDDYNYMRQQLDTITLAIIRQDIFGRGQCLRRRTHTRRTKLVS